MTVTTRDRNVLSETLLRAGLLLAAALPTLASAQNYVFDINSAGSAVAIELPNPAYPAGNIRNGQEGWVRMSYVVTADGRAIDPIVIDSSGGGGFEREARDVLSSWRFEPSESGAEQPYNVADVRSEIYRGRDAATSNFIRRTKRIVTHLRREEIEDARRQADNAYEIGGWNLYESTMLWLMLGRVEGAEGNRVGKLEMYNRARALSTSKSIPAEDRIDLLEKIFLLQSHFQLYAAATRTYSRLLKLIGSEVAAERLSARAEEIKQQLANSDVIAANATVVNSCDCDEGQPLWHYVPARRTFSFDNLKGELERFEARCEDARISGPVVTGNTWTLDDSWGACRVFVFGDGGATFDFLEYLKDSDG